MFKNPKQFTEMVAAAFPILVQSKQKNLAAMCTQMIGITELVCRLSWICLASCLHSYGISVLKVAFGDVVCWFYGGKFVLW